MPRHIVLGNGSLLVNLDRDLNIRDLYYPHVGMENHINGARCRLGVWMEGRFGWSESFKKKTSRYKEETLLTEVSLENDALGIALTVNDTVHYSKDIFLRRLIVKNLSDRPQEVRVFFTHAINLIETNIGDTALYDPAVDAMIHYKKNRYLLMNGSSNEGGIFQYATGLSGINGLEGTWRDAEDGSLSNNPIAQGAVDSTLSLRGKLQPAGFKLFHYWICAGTDFSTVRNLNRLVLKYSPERLMAETEHYHMSWINKQEQNFTHLPEKVVGLFKRSLLILKTQIDNDGAVIAGNDSDAERFNRDHYSYMWPRDGAFTAYGLDKAGYPDFSRRFFNFCSKIVSERGFLLHKFNPDGSLGSSWHPWIGGDGKPQIPIQEDGTALVLFSLWHHYYQYNDIDFIEPLYENLVKKAAKFLIKFRYKDLKLPLPSYDLWEERRGISTFTASAVFGALGVSYYFAKLFGDLEEAEEYKQAALEVREGITRYLYDEERGRFAKMATVIDGGEVHRDLTLDSSLFSLFQFCAFPADDPRVVRTMEAVGEGLWCPTSIGGVARYMGDRYQAVGHYAADFPGNPWIISTLWLAEWCISKAKSVTDLKQADRLLGWVVDRASETGILPEQIDPYTGEHLSVAPLTWSHAAFVVTVMEYLDKLNELGIAKDCGSPIYMRRQLSTAKKIISV